MYEIIINEYFAAAHRLRQYNGDCERLHGHNWKVEVIVEAEELNTIGIGIDFRDLKKIVKKILKELDHKYLNDLPYFKKINPTTENISRFIFEALKTEFKKYEGLKIKKVISWEEENTGASYFE